MATRPTVKSRARTKSSKSSQTDDAELIVALGAAVTSILGNIAQAQASAALRRQRDDLVLLLRRLEKAYAMQAMKLAEARHQMESWRKDSDGWRKEAETLAMGVEREERAVQELTKKNADLARSLAEANAKLARMGGGT